MAARQHDRRGAIKWLLCAAATAGIFGLAQAETMAPKAVVESLNAALLEVMQGADALGYDGRYERLAPVLRASFDFPAMSRIASGRAWRDWSEEDRRGVTEAFTEMSIATYAARFDGYSGERFEIIAEGHGPRDTVLIRSRIVRPADEPVGIDYLLDETADGWQIIDILLDGRFSELARQRSEFAAIVENGGAPALIERLEAKANELADGA